MSALSSTLNLMPAPGMTVARRTGNVISLAEVASANNKEKEKPRFVLFSEHWLKMQVYIQSTLSLPVTTGDFEKKYGHFDEKQKLDDLVQSMRNVQNLSVEFGTPASVIAAMAKDPDYISKGNNGPLYAHIMWIANKIQITANKFCYSMDMLEDMLDPEKNPDEAKREKNLKAILIGKGGMVSQASVVAGEVGVLVLRLSAFNEKMKGANETLKTYTDGGSDGSLRKKAQNEIGRYNQEISDLQDAAEKANQKWRDYTIAATSTSVGLLIITGGLLLPIVGALGGTLGGLAQQQKNRYNDLMRKIAGEKDELRKKVQLETDLAGFDREIPKVLTSMDSFLNDLRNIAFTWETIKATLEQIVSDGDFKKLWEQYDFEEQRLAILMAQSEWRGIAESSKEFTKNSLLQTLTVAFGQQVA